MSKEIIEVLDALSEKLGIAVDWTGQNVLPYLQEIVNKFIKWEIATSIAWIVIMLLVTLVVYLIFRWIRKEDLDFDGIEYFALWFIIGVTAIVIGVQSFDIIEATVFPEKTVYEYITNHIDLD